MTPEELSERLLKSAARIGTLIDDLTDSRFGRQIAGQLVRCGTSPLANYEEARAAESRKDFIHKLSICLKELRESGAWLSLIDEAKLVSRAQVNRCVKEIRRPSSRLRPAVRLSVSDRRLVVASVAR